MSLHERDIERERDTAECQLSDVIKAKRQAISRHSQSPSCWVKRLFLAFDEVVGDFLLSFQFYWRLPSETQAQFQF